MSLDCKIHIKQPNGCPPIAAQSVDRILYRGLRDAVESARDFYCDAEKANTKNVDFDDCDAYGLSVWATTSGVATARAVVPGFRKKCIVKFTVKKADGVLLHTPSNDQPEHHTFWRASTLNLPPTCAVFIPRNTP